MKLHCVFINVSKLSVMKLEKKTITYQNSDETCKNINKCSSCAYEIKF